MTTNIVEFDKELQDFAALIPAQAQAFLAALTIQASDELVNASPVGNPSLWKPNVGKKKREKMRAPAGYVGGRFRGNWQVTQDVPASGIVGGVDPSGAVTKAKARAAATALAPFSVAVIINNLPYGESLDAGHSTQAAAGWFEDAFERIRNVAAAFAERYRGGQ